MLSQFVKELKYPKKWVSIDESRRAFIVLTVSIILGTISGSWLYCKSKKRKQFILILYDLEVKLVQMEGLIFSALSGTSTLKSLKLLDKFLGYLDKYKMQIEGLLDDISIANPRLFNLLNKYFNNLKYSRDKINLESTDEDYTDHFQSMLKNIGKMRAIVKSETFGLDEKK